MAEYHRQAIADLQDEIAKKEVEIIRLKETVNVLAQRGGIEAPYATVELQAQAASAVVARDAFVGKPLHTAIRLYLEARKVATPKTGPATVNEIYDGMIAGGYEFETENVENRKTSVRFTLRKNTAVFYKLGSHYGLVGWYGDKVQKKARKQAAEATTTNGSADEAEEESEESAGTREA